MLSRLLRIRQVRPQIGHDTGVADGRELLEQGLVAFGERPAGEEVGPAGPCAVQGLRPPPPLDPAVVSGTHDVGNGPAAEVGRARVVRVFEETVDV